MNESAFKIETTTTAATITITPPAAAVTTTARHLTKSQNHKNIFLKGNPTAAKTSLAAAKVTANKTLAITNYQTNEALKSFLAYLKAVTLLLLTLKLPSTYSIEHSLEAIKQLSLQFKVLEKWLQSFIYTQSKALSLLKFGNFKCSGDLSIRLKQSFR